MSRVFRKASSDHNIAADPLGAFRVRWKNTTRSELDSFTACLNTARGERQLQKYLQAHPSTLLWPLRGLPLRWIIPQKQLGCEFVTDFMIGEQSSIGFEWIAVELESPKAKLFNKNGDPSKPLNHAIRQLTDWRAWLKKNRDYASRLRTQNGLGLTDIDPELEGIIVIGRQSQLDPKTNERRREMSIRQKAKIHTYDWLAGWDESFDPA